MFAAIVLGGGTGERVDLGYNKVLHKIKGKTVIEYAAKKFVDDEDFAEVIIVMNRDDYDRAKLIFDDKKVKVIKGGSTRQESVYLGLMALSNSDYVFIHDGARPNLMQSSIDKLKHEVRKSACILYRKSHDSLVLFERDYIQSYINRDQIGRVSTPQAFQCIQIKNAYEKAKIEKRFYTDDASLYIQELGLNVKMVEDDEYNIKITTQLDIKIMEELL